MNDYPESEVRESVEAGEWRSVTNLDEMKRRLMAAASETALKDYKDGKYVTGHLAERA